MATDTNGVTLCGRLVKIMEVIHTQSGYAIGNFTIAVNRSRKTQEGNWEDTASFIDCSLMGKSADNLAQYLIKGKQVSIMGYLNQDRWEKNGQKFSRLRVVVTNLQLIGGNREKKEEVNQPQIGYTQEQGPDMEYPNNEDIPF